MYVSDGVQLQGIEDAQGNMDFKVAGTSEGITSLQVGTGYIPILTVLDSRSLAENVVLNHLQLDTKNIPGIPFHVFRDAVMKSRGISHYPTQPHCSGSVSVFSQMLD